MMQVRQKLCPPSRYGIKCPYTRKPDRIVIHNTANDAPAENEISYMISRPEEISFHFAVDDKEVVQGLPLERSAWASGDGCGEGNMRGIHIEICHSLSGGEKFKAAEKNAAEYTAQLLRENGWGIDRVTKHQDYDGKYCPHRTLDEGWQKFLDMIRKFLEEDDMFTYEDFVKFHEQYEAQKASRKQSEWATEAIADMQDAGVMTGDADGKFRPKSNVTREELAVVAQRILEMR